MWKNIQLAGLLFLTGCYRFHEAPLSPEQTLNDFNQRTLTEHASGPQGWGVNELTQTAFYYSAELKEMRAHLREAQGAKASAAERPNPSIGVRPGFNSTTPSGADISPWILDLSLDIPVETAGKRAARTAQAEFRLEAAKLKIASTAWRIRHRIRTAMLELYAARQNASILEQRQQYLQTALEQFKGRLAAGDISAVDLQSVTMEFEIGRNEMAENQRREQESLLNLAQAIGLPVSALNGIQFDFSAFETLPAQVPVPDARRMALLNRADLLGALAEYNAAQMALKEEVAKQYPDVQIGPGYSFDQSEDKWSLGISLNLPLFNRNQGAIKSAEAKRDAVAAVFLQQQEKVAAEIESAVNDYGSFETQRRTSKGLERQTAILVRTTEDMVRLGEVSQVESVQAGLQHNRSQLELLRARINELEALGRLENAMQHPANCPLDESAMNQGESK